MLVAILIKGRIEVAKAKSKASKKSIVVVPKYSLTKSKQVWLTFDDGPHKKHTPKALKVLADQGVKATFFVVGRNVVNAKSLVKEIFDAGHLVSNHSYTHANLTSLNKKQICLLYTSPSPRDATLSRMPSSA